MNLKSKTRHFSKIIFLILVSLNSIWAAGELDMNFNVAAYQEAGYSWNPPMVIQPDGKFIFAFYDYGINNGIVGQGITRFNADGTVDPTFNAPRLASGSISELALQSNGKLLISGNFTIANTSYRDVARLNTDGSLDTSFNALTIPPGREGEKLFVQPDDSFFYGTVYKYDANGFPINTFNYQPYIDYATQIAGTPDGKVYVNIDYPNSNFEFLARHNADGSRDDTFTGISTSLLTQMIPLSDGKLLIAGRFFNTTGGREIFGIARLNANGSIDNTFNPGGVGTDTGLNIGVSGMELLPDGKIMITGSFSTYNGVSRPKIARLNSDGTLDTAYNYSGPLTNMFFGSMKIFPNGRILVSGSFRPVPDLNVAILMLNPDGTLVPDFYIQKAQLHQRVRKTTVQSDGKIYVAGEFQMINGYRRNNLARLNPDGKIDTNFVPFFNNQTSGFQPIQAIHQVLVQPDGKILASFTHGLVITRLNSSGSRDTTFAPPFSVNYIIYDFALQSDGKIIVVGENPFSANTFLFARLNTNGTLDTTFNPTLPNGRIYKILLQPDGKPLICGEFTQVAGSNRSRIARYNADGSLDTSFTSAGGGADGNIYDIDLQADGKIVIGGTFGINIPNGGQLRVGRLNADGTPDASFAQYVDNVVQTVKVQSDGKILLGGLFGNVGGTAREKLARLNSNGTLDSSFTTSANALVFDINQQADGKVLVAGDFNKVNNVYKFGVARLNNSAPAGKPFDYDGDGRSDVSVFRPSENKWFIFKSADSTVSQPIFGSAGDIPTPADFDGDGKTDPAVFRPSNGVWWYLSSVNGNQIAAQWGQNGDIPRPADFDGDDKTDFITFRPSDNKWYRLRNGSETSSIVEFGSAGDKPLVGDFDGDGKADPAIYRPSTGAWWYAASSQNGAHRAVQFGLSTDIPVPADFDGDGKTDFAVYRPSNGVWHILQSSNNNYIAYQFGLSEDKPVAADYDGDGKADMAVFRPSNGVWYQMRSNSGFNAIQWGASNDIPTQNAFIP